MVVFLSRTSSFLIRASSFVWHRRPTKNTARSLYHLSNFWVTWSALARAVPQCLRCRTQGALFRMTVSRRCSLLLGWFAQCCALVLQLGDLKSQESRAHVRD